MGPKMPRDGTQQLAAPSHLERWGIGSLFDISAGVVPGGRSSKTELGDSHMHVLALQPQCVPLEFAASPGIRGEGEGETTRNSWKRD